MTTPELMKKTTKMMKMEPPNLNLKKKLTKNLVIVPNLVKVIKKNPNANNNDLITTIIELNK